MLFQVYDTLDFLQIANEKFQRKVALVDMKKSIRELADMFEIGTVEKGIKLVFECDNGTFPSKLYADEMRIKQVVANLLQNALKFTMHGQIELRLSYEQG